MTHSDKVAEKEYAIFAKMDTAVETSKVMRKAVRTDYSTSKPVQISDVTDLSEDRIRKIFQKEVESPILSQRDIDHTLAEQGLNQNLTKAESRKVYQQ